jgi:hypothetical protein
MRRLKAIAAGAGLAVVIVQERWVQRQVIAALGAGIITYYRHEIAPWLIGLGVCVFFSGLSFMARWMQTWCIRLLSEYHCITVLHSRTWVEAMNVPQHNLVVAAAGIILYYRRDIAQANPWIVALVIVVACIALSAPIGFVGLLYVILGPSVGAVYRRFLLAPLARSLT